MGACRDVVLAEKVVVVQTVVRILRRVDFVCITQEIYIEHGAK